MALLPLFYNPMLAIVNAHIIPLSYVVAAVSETVILIVVSIFVFRKGVLKSQADAVFIIVVACLASIITYLASSVVYIDFIRNILIVSLFTLLGRELLNSEILLVFWCAVSLVMVFLVLEIVSLETYVDIFGPALYYENTRGNEVSEFNEVGVFGNALGFEGRFSYGVISGPRTSSIFLEQVGLANFTIIAAIFFVCYFKNIPAYSSVFLFVFIVLSLLSTESRSAIITIFLFVILFKPVQRCDPLVVMAVMPMTVLLGLVYAAFNSEKVGDNFGGRIVHGFGHLINLNVGDLFGFGVDKINNLWDSGYAYLICSGTLFGALSFWWFLYKQLNRRSMDSKMFIFGVCLFLSLSLSIGGTAVFSIKVAFMYWLIIGYLSRQMKRANVLAV